jgi:hypothetical protein
VPVGEDAVVFRLANGTDIAMTGPGVPMGTGLTHAYRRTGRIRPTGYMVFVAGVAWSYCGGGEWLPRRPVDGSNHCALALMFDVG